MAGLTKSSDLRIRRKASNLAELTCKLTAEAIFNKTISIGQETYFRWIPERFSYGKTGLGNITLAGDYIQKPVGWGAAYSMVDVLKRIPAYSELIGELDAVFHDTSRSANYVKQFVYKVANWCVMHKTLTTHRKGQFIAAFLNDVRCVPQYCSARIELQGLIVYPTKVTIASGITIRPVVRQDLMKEISLQPIPVGNTRQPNPTSILEIKSKACQPADLQKRIDDVVAILRLFRVGGVDWQSYEMKSKAIVSIFGCTSHRVNINQWDHYLLESHEQKDISKFFASLDGKLSAAFRLNRGPTSPIAIAHTRYLDVVLKDAPAESRIATTMMGLEALYLNSGENQELSFKLSVRVAKLLSVVGFSGPRVRDVIREGYRIRSIYAHGGMLDQKSIKKLQDAYGDIKKLLYELLDFMRLSILFFLFCDVHKDILLQLIDESLVSDEKDAELKIHATKVADHIVLAKSQL